MYALYTYNRFQACRYGLESTLVDAYSQKRAPIREDILDTLRVIGFHAGQIGAGEALARIGESGAADRTDAAWLRETYRASGSLNDVARLQSELWMGDVLVRT
ncbi:Carboxylate-amine ligase YbdK [compost metagenome]